MIIQRSAVAFGLLTAMSAGAASAGPVPLTVPRHYVAVHAASFQQSPSDFSSERTTGIAAIGSPGKANALGEACAIHTCGNLTYHGGIVQHVQKIYTIFWNAPNVGQPFPLNYISNNNQFVADLSGSSFYSIASEYGDESGAISSTAIFAGTYTDSTSTLDLNNFDSDSTLQAEVDHARAVNGWPSDPNAYFQIYLPDTVGSGVFYCGFHTYTSGGTYAFGLILFPQNHGSGTCLLNLIFGGTMPHDASSDSAISVSSHEIMETVTDPYFGGWYFQNGGGEIGDECAWIIGTRSSDGSDVTLNGRGYLIQKEWSNAISDCTFSGHGATAPVVILDPLNGAVFTGQTIVFATVAVGSPAPTAQWQYSVNGGLGWINVPGGTGPSLSFAAHRADNGKWFRCVYTNYLGTAATNSGILTVRVRARADFDNDGRSDLVVWEPATGFWSWLDSSTNYAGGNGVYWGNSSLGDVPLIGDIDGDGIADPIVWRASTGTFFWLTSSSGYVSMAQKQWGNQALGDVPMVGDIDGDGKVDLIVWRGTTGTWYWLSSTTGYSYSGAGAKLWGNQSLGDIPLLGDMDGDGLVDLTVWRATNGTFYWLTSSSGYNYASANGVQWGNASLGDVPLLGDLDGDGLTDLVVWRASTGTFFWITAAGNFNPADGHLRQWGDQSLGDVPMLGDIDGDGVADLIVWRASTQTWFWLTSSSNFSGPGQKQFGGSLDIPMVK